MSSPTSTLLMVTPGRIFQDSRGFDSLYYEGNTGDLLGGANGNVYAIEDGETDNGAAIPLRWMSGHLDQGSPNNNKTYQDLVIEHNTGGTELTVELVVNNGDTTYALGNIVSTEKTQTVLTIGSGEEGVTGKNCAVLIFNDTGASSGVVQIFSVFLHYYMEARGALHHDTDELDLGTQKVKHIRALELDLSNPADVSVQLATDMPDNAMATRVQDTITPGTTRRKVQIPIHDYVEGRHVRVMVFSETEFQLYGARAWVQAYGTYIEAYEASHGQMYDSFDLPIVSGHVCQAKCLELDIDTDGNVNAEVLTDLPGNDITLRDGDTFDTTTTTTGRRMMRIPLEPYLDGRLYRVKLWGASALRLYGARLEVKPYGVFVESYEGTAGRTWDSDTTDLGTPKVKEIREIQLDIDTDGSVTCNLYTEIPGLTMTARVATALDTETTTAGRRMVNIPCGAGGTVFEGRLIRLEIIGTSQFKLYGAWLFYRPIGYYVEAYQAGAGHI